MTHVRPYQASDRHAVQALAIRLTEGVAPWRNDVRVRTAVRGWVAESIAQVGHEDAALLIAESGGEVAGFVGITEREHWSGDRDAEIGELVVRTDAEGHGVGRALVAAATQWSRERGLGVLTLATGAANARARGFYARLGFVEEDVRLALVLPPEQSGGVAESESGSVVDDVEVSGG